MPDTVPPTSSALRLIGMCAALDLVVGGVLAVIGVSQDVQFLQIAGVVLLLSGGVMLGWVTWQRSKPTLL